MGCRSPTLYLRKTLWIFLLLAHRGVRGERLLALCQQAQALDGLVPVARDGFTTVLT